MLENLIGQSAAILNSNFIAIVILKDKHIVWANAAMHRIYGYQPNNLIGQPTRNLFLDQDAYEAFGHETGQPIADDRAYADTILQKRKDGTTSWQDNPNNLLSEATEKCVVCPYSDSCEVGALFKNT